MKIGNVVITTKKKFSEIIEKEKAKFIAEELSVLQEEIIENAITEFKKTSEGYAIYTRKELESKVKELEEVANEYSELLRAKEIINKFNEVYHGF